MLTCNKHINAQNAHIYNMTQELTKRIPVSENRWKQLGAIKQAGQTYDNLLSEMIVAYNKEQLAQKARVAKIGEGTWTRLEDL